MNSGGRNPASVAAALLFVLCLLGQTFYCFVRPISDLDTLAYVSLLNGGNQEAFREAASSCALQLPGPHNGCHPEGSPGFRTVAAFSSADFSAFLRFYTVKPLYLGSVWALHRLFRAGGFMACRLVSSVSYFLIGLILALWLREHLRTPAACLCAFLIAALPPVIDLGKLLLPDALSTALLLTVIYLVYYRTHNLGLQLALLAVLPLSRPDNLIFCALFGAALLCRATPVFRKLLWRLTAFATACIGFGALLQKATHTLPYKALLIHTFLDFSAPPSSYSNLHVSIHDYLHVLVSGGARVLEIYFPLPLFLSVLALACARFSRPLRDLLLVSMITAFSRLILCPNMEERFYTWYLLIAAATCTCLIGEALSLKQSRLEAFPRSQFAERAVR